MILRSWTVYNFTCMIVCINTVSKACSFVKNIFTRHGFTYKEIKLLGPHARIAKFRCND